MRQFFRRVVPLLVILGFPASSAFAQADRIDPIPVGPDDIVKALSPFRGNPDSSKVARLIEEQAGKTGFPASDFDQILVARLWRRAEQPELAMTALEQMGGDSEAANLAMYEAARVLLESGLNPRMGRQAYWLACGASDERVQAEIEWDLLAVSTPEEREAWKAAPARENCDWLREFWGERAVRMAVTVDERVATHFQRMVHAREWFWIPRPRFQQAPSDRHGRPKGIAVDDRGLIFVRMGPPETNEGFLGTAGSDFDFGDLDETSQQSTCWPYPRADGYRIFCFAQGTERSDGDYRITEKIGGVPGTHFFQKYIVNSNLPRSAIDEIVRSRGRAIFARTRDPNLLDIGAVETLAGGLKVAVATRDNMDLALKQVPDAPMIISTLNLRFETLRFLNPSAGQWQIWVLSSVRAGDLTPSSEDDEMATLDAGGHYSILTASGVAVNELPGRSLPAGSVDDETGVTLRGVFTADPGPLPLTVVIEDLNAPGDGAWFQDTVNVPAVGGLPQLSDIAVAQQEGGTWTRDGETFLQVSPAHMTNPDGSIHTYFEVYGVLPGTNYEVELRLVPADDAEDIWRLDADDLAFRLQFRSEMSSQIGRHHLRLELRDTKPGEYTLAVRIQDADTGAYSLPAITDVFVAKH